MARDDNEHVVECASGLEADRLWCSRVAENEKEVGSDGVPSNVWRPIDEALNI